MVELSETKQRQVQTRHKNVICTRYNILDVDWMLYWSTTHCCHNLRNLAKNSNLVLIFSHGLGMGETVF